MKFRNSGVVSAAALAMVLIAAPVRAAPLPTQHYMTYEVALEAAQAALAAFARPPAITSQSA